MNLWIAVALAAKVRLLYKAIGPVEHENWYGDARVPALVYRTPQAEIDRTHGKMFGQRSTA